MTRKKKILIASSSAGFVAVAAVALFLLFRVNPTVSYEGTIQAEVGAVLTVRRDSGGIPHIQAASADDAYLALGYLHAQDRIILIEYYRAMARGWLSSLIGEEGMPMDKLSRTIGFSGEAEKLYQGLEPKYKQYLGSYVKGINLFRKMEHRAFRDIAHIPVQDWEPADVISTLMMLEWTGAFLNNREHVFMISDKLLSREVKKVLPPQLTFGYAEDDRNNVLLIKELRTLVSKYAGSFNRGFSFYISSSLTPDEQPVVAFSLDGLNRVYPLWYPVRITVDGTAIAGVTAAGMPFIFSGKNASFSFAGTNLSLDTQDFYRENTRKGAKGQEFFSRGRWVEFKTRDEVIDSIDQSGRPVQVKHQVRYKDDCPVLSDVYKGRFTMDTVTVKHLVPQKEYIKALFEIPFSGSVAAAGRAASNIVTVPKAYIFASKDDAALVYMGAVPQRDAGGAIFRRGENYTGYAQLLNLSAYSQAFRAGSILSGSEMLDMLPAVTNPYKVFNDTARYGRLEELVKARAGEPQYIPEILHDRESQIARKFTPVFYALLDKIPIPSAKLCRVYFKNWDHVAGRTSVPAAVTQLLVYNMFHDTIEDELKDETYRVFDNIYWALDGFYSILGDDNSPLFDNTATDNRVETRNQIFDRAFLKTLKHLNNNCGPYMKEWQWGVLHKAKFSMPLGKQQSIFQREMRKSKLYRMGGDDSTLLKGSVLYNDRFRAGNVTAVSVCYYGQSSSISQAAGLSINPASEFHVFKMDGRQFVDFEPAEHKYEMKFLPSR